MLISVIFVLNQRGSFWRIVMRDESLVTSFNKLGEGNDSKGLESDRPAEKNAVFPSVLETCWCLWYKQGPYPEIGLGKGLLDPDTECCGSFQWQKVKD